MVDLANLLLWNTSEVNENMSIPIAHAVFTGRGIISLDWRKHMTNAELLELCMPLPEVFA